MKRTLLFISIFNILLFGCMKSQISDSLVKQANEKPFSMATVLAVKFDNEDFAECVENGLKRHFPKLKFISGKKFRDTFYPWFEPNTAPDEIAELSAILNKARVRKRIEDLGIELLIYVHGDTHRSNFGGGVGGYGVAVGYAAAERETHISTTLWDLRKIILVGDTYVHSKGTIHIPIIGIPIVIPAFTESSACTETTKRIYNCLTGEISNKDK